MFLDYNYSRRWYILRVATGEANLNSLREEHGLNYSTTSSSGDSHVFFTDCPYAAVTFFKFAGDRARMELSPLKAAIDESWQTESQGHFDVPEGRELWGFQKANVEYARSHTNLLIGDEPGLGKTPSAVAIANDMQAERVLIICPANIRMQWAQMVMEWSTMPGVVLPYVITKGAKGVPSRQRRGNWPYIIVSYDLARTESVWRGLTELDYDLLILDEAHFLKEVGSQRSKAVFTGRPEKKGKSALAAIFSRAERTLALTGTPLPNRPREAFTLARGLCHDSIDWMNERTFYERFNPSCKREGERRDGTKFVYTDERTGRHFELQNRLRGHFMIRHLKHGPKGVSQQLRYPIYDLVYSEEDAAVKAVLHAERMLAIDPDRLQEGLSALAREEKLGHVATVRRMMGVALAPHAADYVALLLDGGEDKFVVFAWHVEVLDILQNKLDKFGCLRIDGSDGESSKFRKVIAFVNDPGKRVIIGNLQSMGTGTDGLQKVCNHALLVEPDWVPGNNQQAFDRIDRGGQTRQVLCDIFVARGSIVDRILRAALRKGHVIEKVLDSAY